jgi:hypothetical protein
MRVSSSGRYVGSSPRRERRSLCGGINTRPRFSDKARAGSGSGEGGSHPYELKCRIGDDDPAANRDTVPQRERAEEVCAET